MYYTLQGSEMLNISTGLSQKSWGLRQPPFLFSDYIKLVFSKTSTLPMIIIIIIIFNKMFSNKV